MSLLNLGILAHVDAGKTSLTERLLYEAGVIEAPGSVDAGTTRTDSMDLERRRGITIRANVAVLAMGDLQIQLIDTPGHPDFIAEVERSLAVLDAAVLVVSAVEGVQPQTVLLWRALVRTGIPTLLFVNKIDRRGADLARLESQILARLTARIAPLARAGRIGTREAVVRSVSLTSGSVVQALAEVDEAVLGCWIAGRPVEAGQVRRAIRRGAVTPLLCGSALTGAGMPQLRWAIAELLPVAIGSDESAHEHGGELAATVFAVDHDDRGRRVWLRMWSGRFRVRARYAVRGGYPERITEIAVLGPAGAQVRPAADAGAVVQIRGPKTWRVGDVLGRPPRRVSHSFAPPTLQAVVEPVDAGRRIAMFAALTELADEDPLIGLRLDDNDDQAAVSLHGQVQQEILGALLAERYGVPVRFRTLSVVCIEQVVGVGEALERIAVEDNPYLATIGLRIESTLAGRGVEFRPAGHAGRLPAAFLTATEEGVRAALQQGLHGWPVTDCVVSMTASGYYPRQSHAHQKFSKAMSSVGADFRLLAQVVVMAALRIAGTRVCEPVDHFDLDTPDEQVSSALGLLGRLGAVVDGSSSQRGWTALIGQLPAARTADLARALPDAASGEAVLSTRASHYTTTQGPAPFRRRRGPDPLDRAGWFHAMPR